MTGPATALVRRLPLAAALAFALEAAAARADAPVASDPVFTVLATDGGTVSGRIKQFGPGGDLTIVTVAGPDRVVPIGSLVKLMREGANPPTTPEPSVVVFPGGDRLYRTAIGAAGETALEVQSFSLGRLAVPLESVLGLVLAPPADGDALDQTILTLREEPRTSEVVWLANGDKLSGGFLSLTDRTVEFQAAKDPVKLERTGVLALGFDPSLVVYPKPTAPYYDATLSDGSRLGLSGLSLEQGHLAASTRFGTRIKFPLTELIRLHARTPSVVYLSEREPAAEGYVSYVGPHRPFRRDASVEGHPLRVCGQEFDRGIGTQSRTLLAYRLEPGDRRFQAQVGLDDRAGPLGNVAFRVLVDNVQRYASPPMSARDTPRTIDLDVAGKKTLVLITEFGERGGVRDVADWGEARVVR